MQLAEVKDSVLLGVIRGSVKVNSTAEAGEGRGTFRSTVDSAAVGAFMQTLPEGDLAGE